MDAETYYDRNASKYDGDLFAALPYTVETRFNHLFSLMNREKAAEGLRILEVAAGTGAYSPKLAALRPARLVVTDISQGMLDVAAAKVGAAAGDVEFRRCGCEELPFADASFDLAVCFAGFHHFSDRAAAFSEIARVLDAGGGLLMMEPNPLHPMNFLLGVGKRIERGMLASWPRCWRRAAEKGGLRLDAFRYGSFFPGWPERFVPLYDRAERILNRVPLIRNFAIFGFYRFSRAAE